MTTIQPEWQHAGHQSCRVEIGRLEIGVRRRQIAGEWWMHKANDAETKLDLIRRVLAVYDTADDREGLFWRVGREVPGKIELSAMCNDLFEWATSDCEEITANNVAILEQTLVDLQELDRTVEYPPNAKSEHPLLYLSRLFAARSRKMRPQQPCYRTIPPVIAALFDACGPVRDRASEG